MEERSRNVKQMNHVKEEGKKKKKKADRKDGF